MDNMNIITRRLVIASGGKGRADIEVQEPRQDERVSFEAIPSTASPYEGPAIIQNLWWTPDSGLRSLANGLLKVRVERAIQSIDRAYVEVRATERPTRAAILVYTAFGVPDLGTPPAEVQSFRNLTINHAFQQFGIADNAHTSYKLPPANPQHVGIEYYFRITQTEAFRLKVQVGRDRDRIIFRDQTDGKVSKIGKRVERDNTTTTQDCFIILSCRQPRVWSIESRLRDWELTL